MGAIFAETSYPIYPGMPVYPGLPEVRFELNECLEKGDEWNGSMMMIYLHARTHVDAPWHYIGGRAAGIDSIPIDNFFYEAPLLINIPEKEKNYLISVADIKNYSNLDQCDILIFNTQYHKRRGTNFLDYATGFPALAPEAAEYIREKLPNIKAVAIDTLSIENIALGKRNGFRTHKAFLDPDRKNHTVLIYEDVNVAPIVGRELIGAYCTPLRLVGRDASICNLVFKIKE